MSRGRTVSATVVAVLLLLGATACSGDDGAASDDATTTIAETGTDETTATTTAEDGAGDLPAGRIVFRRFDEAQLGASLFTMNPDGSDEQALTELAAPSVHNLPEWSPDGTQVAYQHENADGLQSVHVVDAEGSDDVAVDATCPAETPDALICEEGNPSWTADGEHLVIANPHGEIEGDIIERFTVSEVPVTGGAPVPITNLEAGSGYEDYGPAVSPDGSRIVFIREYVNGEQEGAALFVANIDGSGEERITDWELRSDDPAWSSDGERISFRSQPDEDAEFVGQLFTIAADGTDLQALTEDDGREVYGSTWSPDDEWIAFAQTGEDDLPDIWLIRPDGSDLTQVTRTPVWDDAPDWSPA